MAKNKSYESYKFPKLAKTFDNKSLYIIFTIFALVVTVGYGGWTTLNTIHDMGKPLATTSQYQNVAISDSMGVKWAKNFVSTPPEYINFNKNEWNVSNTITPKQPIDFKECNSFNLLSPTVLASTEGEGKGLQVSTQLYTTAYALKGYNDYKKTFSKCWTVNTKNYGSGQKATEVANYGKGFFFTYGDAVIFVQADNVDDKLINYYLNRASSSLLKYNCNMLTTNPNDTKRSIYLNPKDYSGYWKSETVNTNVKLDNIPTPVFPAIKDVSYVAQPEAPLPKNFPQLPKTTPNKPSIPSNPDSTKKAFSKKISYQVTDDIGPTCGWNWLGFKAPITDDAHLRDLQKNLEASTLKLLNGNAQDYVNNKISYSRNLISLMDDIEGWNSYTKIVDGVNNKRTWLTDQRNKLEPSWRQYVTDHDNWLNFDTIKNDAITNYNSQVDKCNAANKAVSDWDDKWGALYQQQNQESQSPSPSSSDDNSQTPTPSSTDNGDNTNPTPTYTNPVPVPTPSSSNTPSTTSSSEITNNHSSPSSASTVNIPPRPSGCNTTPVLPDIANQSKGAEPQAPTIPAGVTIPNSWPKSAKTPTDPANGDSSNN